VDLLPRNRSQLLLLRVDRALFGHGRSREEIIDPSAFVFPPKKLPKGQVGLFFGYGNLLLDIDRSPHEVLELFRDRSRALIAELVVRLRVPLVIGCGVSVVVPNRAAPEQHISLDDRSLLVLRRFEDMVALLGNLSGWSGSDLLCEMKKFVDRCDGVRQAAIAESAANVSLAADALKVPAATSDDASRRKRRRGAGLAKRGPTGDGSQLVAGKGTSRGDRSGDEDDDGFDLVEDTAPAAVAGHKVPRPRGVERHAERDGNK
jgi:hypothetical protein